MDIQEREAKLAELAQQIAQAQVQPGHAARNGHEVETRGDGFPTATEDRGTDRQAAQARAICLRLLAVAPRPRAGLAGALRRKEIPDDVASAVLDRFTELGLIDDAAYAQSYGRVKHRDRALGRAALRTELRKLGVEEEVMTTAVGAIDSDAERRRAAELIDKRIDAAMTVGSVAARRRLLGLLARRGYPADIAVPVVEEALASYDGEIGERF